MLKWSSVNEGVFARGCKEGGERIIYCKGIEADPTTHFRKCILGHGVGTDHVDLDYCRRSNIQVMNCTNCNSETVAEHAISLVGPHFYELCVEMS